jgi:hypothetical protein
MRRLSASIGQLDLQTNRSSNVPKELQLKLVILPALPERESMGDSEYMRSRKEVKKRGMVALRNIECLPKCEDQTEDAPIGLYPEVP